MQIKNSSGFLVAILLLGSVSGLHAADPHRKQTTPPARGGSGGGRSSLSANIGSQGGAASQLDHSNWAGGYQSGRDNVSGAIHTGAGGYQNPNMSLPSNVGAHQGSYPPSALLGYAAKPSQVKPEPRQGSMAPGNGLGAKVRGALSYASEMNLREQAAKHPYLTAGLASGCATAVVGKVVKNVPIVKGFMAGGALGAAGYAAYQNKEALRTAPAALSAFQKDARAALALGALAVKLKKEYDINLMECLRDHEKCEFLAASIRKLGVQQGSGEPDSD